MTVRRARAADLPLLAAIETPKPAETTAVTLADAVLRGTLWTATDADDAPVGFLLAEPVGTWLHIVEIAVATPSQNTGLGRALVDAAAAAAPAIGCSTLSSITDRGSGGAACYARHGFIEIAAAAAPFWLAAIVARDIAAGRDAERRCAMFRALP